MTTWSAESAKAFFDEAFQSPTSNTYLAITRIQEPEEVLPGTIYHFDVGHKIYGRCSARMYCGLDNNLGGRLWLQETQSLLRLSTKQHPALPRVREGIFRDDDGVGLVLSEATGQTLGAEDQEALRTRPAMSLRFLNMATDALRVLHGYGLIHRDIWRGSFETVQDATSGDRPPYLRLFGFEMSAFAASLADPAWRTTDDEWQRLQQYRSRGGAEQFACRAPEVVAEEAQYGSATSTYASDVYALGVCAFQWFVNELPHELLAKRSTFPIEVAQQLTRELTRQLGGATQLARPLRDLLARMIRFDPTGRPTASELATYLGAYQDDISVMWSVTGITTPYILSISPAYFQSFVQIEEWRNLASDDDLLYAEIKTRIEKDLCNGILIHEPAGAERYVRSGDRQGLAESVWVLIGKRAIYFCQKFQARRGIGGAFKVLEWILHINYVVDRCEDRVRDIACTPLRKRVPRVTVIHHHKAPEVDPTNGRGSNPSWSPLLAEVQVPSTKLEWQLSMRKGFEWWMSVQRATLDIRYYAFKKSIQSDSRAAGKTIRLTWDTVRDQKWIERDHLRFLLATGNKKRPAFGDFFDTLSDRDLGEDVVWYTDASGRPERRAESQARGRVLRIGANEVELKVMEGAFPPSYGWLRPASDIAGDTLFRRQEHAVSALFSKPDLMQALYRPKSFRGPMRPWLDAGKGLKGRGSEIVKNLLAYFPFYALQGPPGTGKTTVVTHAVTAYLRAKPGARVLVSAQSHFALDELASRLVGAAIREDSQDIVAVRVASQHSIDQVRESVRPFLDVNQAHRVVQDLRAHVRRISKQYEQDDSFQPLKAIAVKWAEVADKHEWELQDRLWRGANIVFATCGACTEAMLGIDNEFDQFDWVIVEEAAKAWPAELVMPLVFGHRWTLIGDHKQLPPYGDLEIKRLYELCVSSVREDLRHLVDDQEPFRAMLDLFRHLFEPEHFMEERNDKTNRRGELPEPPLFGVQHSPMEQLDMQFRMDDVICKLISKTFYPDSNLHSAPDLKLPAPMHGLLQPKYLSERALVWLDTGKLINCRHEEKMWHNDGEAAVVAKLVDRFRPSLVTAQVASGYLAILSPYQSQNSVLRTHLGSTATGLVHTTDSFQGREAEIVIVSLVRTNDEALENKYKRLGHLASEQRTNVLLSRAKYLLVIVGDFAHFKDTRESPWRLVCDYVEAQGARVQPETMEDV